MEQQWSTLVKAGRVSESKRRPVSAVVENVYFISKLSFDCLYCYAAAKAEVRLTGSNSFREYQLRDLIFVTFLLFVSPPSPLLHLLLVCS